ncbi:head completion/stabilization protein [Vibrio amylolyticus]|uniref:head completion/stabilization protein n=1 Tax=Vibrio amylolyticus TaxID=2847292 RepID=UPI00354AD526
MFSPGSNADYQDTVITNDGFWPDLNAGDFERRRRVPAHMDKDTIAFAIAAAIGQTNITLELVKAGHLANGYQKASEIPDLPSVLNQNLVEVAYCKAVFALAKAELLPEYATQQTKDAGDRVAESAVETKDSLLAESQQHIRTLQGKTRCGVDYL